MTIALHPEGRCCSLIIRPRLEWPMWFCTLIVAEWHGSCSGHVCLVWGQGGAIFSRLPMGHAFSPVLAQADLETAHHQFRSGTPSLTDVGLLGFPTNIVSALAHGRSFVALTKMVDNTPTQACCGHMVCDIGVQVSVSSIFTRKSSSTNTNVVFECVSNVTQHTFIFG